MNVGLIKANEDFMKLIILSTLFLIQMATQVLFAQTNTEFQKQTGAVVNDPKLLWGSTPQESLILPMMNQYVVNEVIKIRPVKAHHFNLKAFNSCNSKKPVKATEQEINCQFNEAGKYKVSVYICDDAKTYCKFQFIHVEITAPRGYRAALKKHVSSNILYVPKVEIHAPASFIKNKTEYAINQAKKENKLLFIEFAAHWCPACNMLAENVFETELFTKATKDMVKLIVDVDSDISWELKDKFKVGGYPTTVIATPQLSEVGRVVGYRSPAAMVNWVEQMKTLENEPMDFVISKVSQLKPSKDAPEFKAEYQAKVMRLAMWHYERDELKEALVYFQQIDSLEARKMALMTELKIKKDDTKQAASILTQLIKDFPQDVNMASWLSQITDLNGKDAQKVVEKNSAQALSWAANPNLESTDFSKTDIYYMVAEAFDSVEQPGEARANYKKCADEFEALSKLSKLKSPRGALMEQAFCSTKAGDNKKAIDIFGKLAQQYKTEFAFNYYYARALQQDLNNKEALKFASRAYENAYGDNLIRAATLKAQLELELKDLKTAERTAASTLDRVYLPQTQNIRTHRYVANLRSVLEKIQYIKTGKAEGIQ